MAVYTLINVSKEYKTKENTFLALNKITVSFNHTGLTMIKGRSGCGKSTLLNILSLIDKPSKGQVYFNGKIINKIRQNKINNYRQNYIANVFQHYQLIGHLSVYLNIALPLLIKGKKKKEIDQKINNLLDKVNLHKNILLKKADDLSGGEKQRVAILRCLINDPFILLCDEPTGAIDSNNRIDVMNILKNISKDKMVIVVTHDEEIVNNYADRIIEMSEGKIISDRIIKETNKMDIEIKRTQKTHFNTNNILFDNLKRRFKKNIISLFSLVFCLTLSLLIFGFSHGANNSINEQAIQQFDYGVTTFYKEYKTSLEGTSMSLVKMIKPTVDEIDKLKPYLEDYYLSYNFDNLLNPYPEISYNDKSIEGISYCPIYSFLSNSVDTSLLINGYFPKKDNLSEVIINDSAYKLLQKKINFSPLYQSFTVRSRAIHNYYSLDESNPLIVDYFLYEQKIQIVGVVKEMGFLQTPKIYYPYVALENYLQNYLLNNLSEYLAIPYSYYDCVVYAVDDDFSPYSYRLFLKNFDQHSYLEKRIKNIPHPYIIESNGVIIKQTLDEIVNALTYGMTFFLIISFIGVLAIFGIINFSSYVEDKKMITVMKVLGANDSDILNIYLNESMISGILSIIFSIFLALLLSNVLNRIIQFFTGFINMITIPFSYFSTPLFIPIFLLILMIFICVLSTALPIKASKKMILSEELKEE